MWIFLYQIPSESTRPQLGSFVSKGLKRSCTLLPFPSQAKIKRCEILQIFSPESNTTEYHGLVQMDPGEAALSVIKRLSGHQFQGKLIEVREYFRRSSNRDRRRILTGRHGRQELRRKDRRRDRLKRSVLRAPEMEQVICDL